MANMLEGSESFESFNTACVVLVDMWELGNIVTACDRYEQGVAITLSGEWFKIEQMIMIVSQEPFLKSKQQWDNTWKLDFNSRDNDATAW